MTAIANPIYAAPKSAAVSRYATIGARMLLGLTFFVTGLNGVVPFLPPPSPDAMPAGAMDLMIGLVKSGYMLPLLAITQLLAGALLLSNRFVPLALTILAPVIVNIVAFHVFLAPQGLPIAIAVVALEIYLAVVHRKAFRAMIASR
jgi:hypothetical protein